MEECTYVANSGVKRVLYGKPRGHKHNRLVLELSDGKTLVFSEATVANIVRAYVTVHTHPVKRAVELVAATPPDRKPGYAEHQLLESTAGEKVEEELQKIVETCSKIIS